MKLEQPGWTRHLPTEGVLAMATLGPLGLRMKAPGTWGSAAGLVFFVVCLRPLSVAESLLANLVLAYLAVGVCGEAEMRLGRHDPGEVILDEFVAMPLCFVGWPMICSGGLVPFLALLAAGFGLFRLYDIWKPLVIDSLQELPGGWGVVVDDTAAALATCATLHLGHALWALV
jgi:phosphatidylglycerophosphatase A